MMPLARCGECERLFPAHIIHPIQTNIPGYARGCVCAICALRLRNEAHGIPADTPFDGPNARRLHAEATEYLRQQGGTP